MNETDSKKLDTIQACAELGEASSEDVYYLISKVKEQDREIAELEIARKSTQLALWQQSERAEKAEARVKELEELLGEETYAERATVRHYKRSKELEEGLKDLLSVCPLSYNSMEARDNAENLLAEKEKE